MHLGMNMHVPPVNPVKIAKPPSVLARVMVLLCTVAVLALLLYHVGISGVRGVIAGISPAYWMGLIGLTLFLGFLPAWRWKLILDSVGFRISVFECLVIILGVWPLSALSPSKSGDFLRAVCLRKRIGPTIVIGSVLTERFFDLFSLAIWALVGSLFLQQAPAALISGLIVLGFIILILVVDRQFKIPFSTRFTLTLQDLLRTLRQVKKSFYYLAFVFFISVGKWFLTFVLTKALFSAIGIDVPLVYALSAMPVAIVAGLLPVTLGGMGIREGAMMVLFADYAAPEQILAVGLLYTFLGYWLFSFPGLIFTKRVLGGQHAGGRQSC